jgi:outer membrane receptor protein involved in Fe transport
MIEVFMFRRGHFVRGRALLAGGTAALGLLAGAAQAQTLLEPIIVSAEKIDQNAQKVPASLTAIPRRQIEEASIDDVQDLSHSSPNIVLSDQGSQRFSVNAIRGIGSTIRDDYFNSAIGIYLDGVPLTNAEFNRRFGDIEQIEILRGPQGTLYGHNTPAGVINLTSRAPTDALRAEATGTIGDNGRREGSLWLSGPLAGPELTGRLFIDYAHRNGFTDYLNFPGTIDGLEALTASGAIRYAPDDQFTVTLSGAVEHVNQGAYAYQPFDTYRNRVLDIAPPNEEVRDSRSLGATVTYDFGNVELTSITGFRSYDVKSEQDLNYNPFVGMYGGGRTNSEESGRQISQEFRFAGRHGSLTWLAGAFVQGDKVDFDYVFDMPAFGPPSLSASSYSRREIAGFGEVTWNVAGGLDLTAGLRLAHERHELTSNAPFDGVADFTLPTPKFRAAYRFDDDRLIYVSATRGARSGGFNRLSANDSYKSEYLWSYEAGFKSEWLDDRLTLNGAVFYIDWTSQQIKSMTSPGVVETINAGRSHSQGIELEASWRPVEGLDLSGYLGAMHGTYDSFIGQEGTSLAGNRLVNMPSMTAGLAAQYRWQLQSLPYTAFVRGEYHYVGDHNFDPENRLKQAGYGLVNLRAGLENDRFSATVFVRNLLDQDYRTYGYRDFQGSPLATDIAVAGEPRMIGLTLKARY